MEALVILVVVALSLALAAAAAAAILWSVLSLMSVLHSRATASVPVPAVAEEMPIAAQVAA